MIIIIYIFLFLNFEANLFVSKLSEEQVFMKVF